MSETRGEPNCPACNDGECPLHLGTPSHLGDAGFWGRACARLINKRNADHKTLLTLAEQLEQLNVRDPLDILTTVMGVAKALRYMATKDPHEDLL